MALVVVIERSAQAAQPGVRSVRLQGRLDTETADQLDHQLLSLWQESFELLVFNLAELVYISSMGLRSLFMAQKAMKERQGRTLFVDAQPAVQKVFDIVQAVDVGSVFASAAELDTYLDSMQRKLTDPDQS